MFNVYEDLLKPMFYILNYVIMDYVSVSWLEVLGICYFCNITFRNINMFNYRV